jgi:GntR family transcriptional regulator
MTEAGVPTDKRALALILRDKILEQLRESELKPGDALPTEKSYTEQFKVSRPTVREALRILEREGLVRSRQGKGRFLTAQNPIDRPLTRLEGVTELMATRGIQPRNEVVSVDVAIATEEESTELDLGLDAAVVRLIRARYRDDTLLVYSIDVLPRDLIEGSIHDIDWSESLFGFLDSIGHASVFSYAAIRADTFPHAAARELHVKQSEPWLVMNQKHVDGGGRPILLSVDYHRADSFTFNVIRKREAPPK